MFDSLLKRKRLADNHVRLNAGIVAAAILNSAPGDPNRKPISPLDFVTDWAPQAPDLSKMSPNQAKEYLLGMFGDSLKKRDNKVIRKPR